MNYLATFKATFDFEKAASVARELGSSYSKEIQSLKGVVNPEDNIWTNFHDSILKLAEFTGLMEKIETSHDSLKGVIARKYGEHKS